MSKLTCVLIGHKSFDTPGGQCCERCGDSYDLYDDQSREWTNRQALGIAWPAIALWRWLASFAWPRCATCGRRLWWHRKRAPGCKWLAWCDEECEDRWIPF